MPYSNDNAAQHQISDEQLEFAEDNSLHVVRFVCDGRDASGNPRRDLFFVSLHHLPRGGDRVCLNDGRRGTVRKVLFNLHGEGDYQYAFPTVSITLDDPSKASGDGSRY